MYSSIQIATFIVIRQGYGFISCLRTRCTYLVKYGNWHKTVQMFCGIRDERGKFWPLHDWLDCFLVSMGVEICHVDTQFHNAFNDLYVRPQFYEIRGEHGKLWPLHDWVDYVRCS